MRVSKRALIPLSLLFLMGCSLFGEQRKLVVVERWETANNTFKVRVIASLATLEGRNTLPDPIYLYKFESAEVGSDQWQEVMSDDRVKPAPIPREQVRFVGGRVGYMYMGSSYAATADGGKTWVRWNPLLTMLNTHCCYTIRDVQLSEGGEGIAVVSMDFDPPRESKMYTLTTKDYGENWLLK